jgi:D-beta-D-heptose 7-phosphate kinase/D-beta-D-heptose 1-phosphate adenosyltransferase
MLVHLRPVDLVVKKPLTAKKWELIKLIRPDVLIATPGNYSNAEKKELKKYCGEVIVLPRQATTTTSAKIRLLQIGTAKRLGKALTPKLISTIQSALDEISSR